MGLLMLNGIAYAGFTEPAEIYSEEEREIGVWMDGKPIYERVITFNSPLSISGGSWVKISSDDTIVPIKVRGLYYNKCETRPISADSDPGDGLYIKSHESATLDAIILEYTKTTDVAGSGTWTTNGTPTHHYSTNEQVIGTWVDGKPLYEKTFVIPKADMTGADMRINHNISNLGKIIEITGTMLADNANPINTGYQWGTQWGCALGDITSTNFYLRMGTSRYSSVTEVIVILRYTKTTD